MIEHDFTRTKKNVYKTYLEAILGYDGLTLEQIPDEHQSKNMCLKACRENGLALEFCFHRDKDIIMAAIDQDPNAFKFLLDEEQTEEICLQVLKSNILLYCYIINPSAEIKDLMMKSHVFANYIFLRDCFRHH